MGETWNQSKKNGRIVECSGVKIATCHAATPAPDAWRHAQLIAAAPDLLEACEAYYYGRKENRECEAMMRAAIAKATGATT